MALRSASTFACGCSLQSGVMIILTFHLAACLFYFVSAFSHIVMHVGSFGMTQYDHGMLPSSNPVWQFSMIGFVMCGIPIICAAMYGVVKRMDVAVRLYLLYLLATFVLDTVALMYLYLWKDSCDGPGTAMSKLTSQVGKAFMCGFLRIFSYLFVAVTVSAEVYCLFIVWSLCEDVHEGAAGPGLWELIPGKEEALKKNEGVVAGEREGPHADIVGLATSDLPGAYPSPNGPYGALQEIGFGRNSIFGGRAHEMSYPPSPGYGYGY